jgi:hypothetical protein
MCVACDLIIGPQDVEVEADFEDGSALRYHFVCFKAWLRASASSLNDHATSWPRATHADRTLDHIG